MPSSASIGTECDLLDAAAVKHRRLHRSPLLVLVVLTSACAGTLPEPIYQNQVDTYFPPDSGGEVATDGAVTEPAPEVTPEGVVADGTVDGTSPAETPETTVATEEASAVDVGEEEEMLTLRHAAELCAARLNGHRDTAEIVSIFQGIISGFGGATSGVGGVLSAIDFGNKDITTAMGVMSSIGAGITLIGNLIIGLVANPLEETRRHGLGLRSWELAVELQYGHADEEAIRSSLERCSVDEGPPVRVVGAGVAFSL